MRVFVAVTLNDDVKDAIWETQDRLWSRVQSGRATDPENFHLTLAFIGDVPPSKFSKIRRAMELAADGGFELRFGELGRFRRTGGDIWWLGVEKNEKLTALATKLQAHLRDYGFDIEEREFSPHLTLGRQVVLKNGPRIEPADVPVQQVREIHLMKSERIQGVLTYTPVFSQLL